MAADARLRAARFVAEYWRDAFMRLGPYSAMRACSHPLAMVLGALDGETDPVQLGLDVDGHEAFRAALAASREGQSG